MSMPKFREETKNDEGTYMDVVNFIDDKDTSVKEINNIHTILCYLDADYRFDEKEVIEFISKHIKHDLRICDSLDTEYLESLGNVLAENGIIIHRFYYKTKTFIYY